MSSEQFQLNGVHVVRSSKTDQFLKIKLHGRPEAEFQFLQVIPEAGQHEKKPNFQMLH